MHLFVLLLLTCVISHIVLFNSSHDLNRKKRLVTALSVLGLSIVLLIIGILIGPSGNSENKWLALILVYAPVYMSVMSFAVFWRWPRKQHNE